MAASRWDPSWEWRELAERADAAMEAEARHSGAGRRHHNLTAPEALVELLANVQFVHHYDGEDP